MSKFKRPAYYLGWTLTCKDCKWFNGKDLCSQPFRRGQGYIYVSANGSCAFLERKDNESTN